ncbi:hypothetical protein Cni_G17116 [Canna indica]|uniref:Uncharacterized protein n=1 Tax=Canna indica TaxID=4628 RepID=A0AAQ3KK48_9LILI|nr:hypothetical protein Cni_G17116 [Canna indica]
MQAKNHCLETLECMMLMATCECILKAFSFFEVMDKIYLLRSSISNSTLDICSDCYLCSLCNLILMTRRKQRWRFSWFRSTFFEKLHMSLQKPFSSFQHKLNTIY